MILSQQENQHKKKWRKKGEKRLKGEWEDAMQENELESSEKVKEVELCGMPLLLFMEGTVAWN